MPWLTWVLGWSPFIMHPLQLFNSTLPYKHSVMFSTSFPKLSVHCKFLHAFSVCDTDNDMCYENWNHDNDSPSDNTTVVCVTSIGHICYSRVQCSLCESCFWATGFRHGRYTYSECDYAWCWSRSRTLLLCSPVPGKNYRMRCRDSSCVQWYGFPSLHWRIGLEYSWCDSYYSVRKASF